MAAAFTLVDKWDDGQRVHVLSTLALSGSYATGGEAVTLQATLSALVAALRSNPSYVAIDGKAGYKYEYNAATAKVMVRQCAASGNPMAEIPAAAYPAGVTGDVINVYTIFKKFV